MATEKEQSSGCGCGGCLLALVLFVGFVVFIGGPNPFKKAEPVPVTYEAYETGGGSTTALITYATENGINQETASLPWSKDLEVPPGTPITLSAQAQGTQAYLSVTIIQGHLAYESPTGNCNGDYCMATVGTIAGKKSE